MRANADPRDVRVTGGMVRGFRDGSTIAWRGIPYAAPPVKSLRFRAPRPVVEWQGRRDASEFGLVATQAFRGQFRGIGPGVPSGEDCLTINVISPAGSQPTLRGKPVMVFIHGGGYSAGSSREFTGETFVRSGRVVYVSFNYRLSALGYLDFSRYSTRKRPIDANLGLRDQVAALKWVRANIRAFGGDPTNVTVFGESAGGNAVTTLLATPSARGLFARAMAQSSPPNAVYSQELAAKWAGEFVKILMATRPSEHTTDEPTTGEVVALLSATSAKDLVTAAVTLQGRTPDSDPGTFCLAPVVDGKFLPRRPLEALRTGRAHRVPLIIGTNDREGSIFRGRIDILPRSVHRIASLFEGAPAESWDEMRTSYPGLPSGRGASDFAGDFAFWYPSLKVAEYHSRYAPVYVYRFDVAPRLLRLVGLDATHGIEMYALFDRGDDGMARAMTALGGRLPLTRAGDRMRESWLRFAHTGELAEDWPRYRTPDRITRIIGEIDRLDSDPRAERRKAWDRFLPLD